MTWGQFSTLDYDPLGPFSTGSKFKNVTPAAIFVDGQEPFSGGHNQTASGTAQASLKQSDWWSRRRCDNEIVTV